MHFHTAILAGLAALTIANPIAASSDPADLPVDVAVAYFDEVNYNAQTGGAAVLDTMLNTKSKDVSTTGEGGVKKRNPAMIILATYAIEGIATITEAAFTFGISAASTVVFWNGARERFIKSTAQRMWQKNPNNRQWPGVACYNKGYHMKNGNFGGRLSAHFELGALWTNYDCMYIGRGNAFYTNAEGGSVNLAYTYNKNVCSFDQKTGDLTCK